MQKKIKAGWASVSAITLVALAACGSAEQPNPGSPQGGSEIVVGSWGGDYQNFLKQYVLPELSEMENAPEVVFATADHIARATKLRTQKDSETGTMDVALMSDTSMEAMKQAGILEKLDTSKIPNLKYVKDELKNPYWIPHIYSPSVIIYNKEKVKPAPTSYEALWDQKYAGKVGVETAQYIDVFHAASVVAPGDDPKHNWDAARPMLKELAPSTQAFSSKERLGSGLMSGQVWMAVNWKARALQWIETSDAPLATAVPEEGTISTSFNAGIPKNAPNKEAAYKFLNAMLEPAAQRGFAKNMGYAPTITNSDLPDQLLEKLGLPEDKESLLHPVDISFYAKNLGPWSEFWVREVVNH